MGWEAALQPAASIHSCKARSPCPKQHHTLRTKISFEAADHVVTQGKRTAIKYGAADSTASLGIAFFINAAILILAAAAFYYSTTEHREVATLTDAYNLLAPAVGRKAAKILFAVALLAAGQNSSITGTLAGQIVMEGFLHIR